MPGSRQFWMMFQSASLLDPAASAAPAQDTPNRKRSATNSDRPPVKPASFLMGSLSVGGTVGLSPGGDSDRRIHFVAPSPSPRPSPAGGEGELDQGNYRE